MGVLGIMGGLGVMGVESGKMSKFAVDMETERLILRQWLDSDAEAFYRYASDGRVSEMAMWPRHESPEMSLRVIREIFQPNPDSFAMVDKETGEAIGCIGLVPPGEENYPVAEGEREAGYWVGHPYWGRGLTTEALGALTAYCRDTLGLRSLLITTDRRNVASQRVAEKCGFRFVADFVCQGTESRAYRLEVREERM